LGLNRFLNTQKGEVMRVKHPFIQVVLAIIIFISDLSLGIINGLEEVEASDSNNKSKLSRTNPVTLPIKAPWLAGVTFEMGKFGSFYHDDPYHHNADDYAIDFNGSLSLNQPIKDNYVMAAAVADGEVREAGWSNVGYGYTVVVGHPGSYESRYAHLRENSLTVKIGDEVTQGTPLGYIGTTGLLPGNEHLHFAMYYCQKDCHISENIQSQKPEPMESLENFKDKDELTSTNYGVGYEKYVCIPNVDCFQEQDRNRLFHASFKETYARYGGQAGLFGSSMDFVNKYENTDYFYQEFGPYHFDPISPYFGSTSALLESKGVAYLLLGPIWEKYKQEGGPSGRLGQPLTDTYEWKEASARILGFRNDFENGSIVWTSDGNTEIIDESNSDWKLTFYLLSNFTNPLITRFDKSLNLSWTPNVTTSQFSDFSTGNFSAVIAERDFESGFLSKTDLEASIQGYMKLMLDNKEIKPIIESPDSPTGEVYSALRFTVPKVSVHFWQEQNKPAILAVSATQSQLLGGTNLDQYLMLDIPQYPQIVYADYTPPTYQDVQSRSTDTVLVFDTSGSMNEPDLSGTTKINAAMQAGFQILNIIEAENIALVGSSQVGVISYDIASRVVSPLTTDIILLKDMISGMSANGGTAMADGLKAGIDLFSSAFANKTLILLSDGLPNISLNSGNSQDEAFVQQQVIDLAAQAGQQGICVNTVGFGDPSLGTDSIDEDFLTRVALASGCGQFYYATDAIELANVYVELRHTSTGIIQFQKTGQIALGEQIDLGSVQIPEFQELFLFTVNWPGSKLQPVLIDPSGITVDNSYAGVSISETSSLISYILNNPIPGNWQLQLLGLDVPQGLTDFNAILSTRAGVIPSPTPIPTPIPTQVVIQDKGGGGIGIFLFILVLFGAGLAVFVYTNTLKNKKAKEVVVNSTGARIRAERGEYRDTIIAIRDGFVIGRGSLCNLKLSDSSISRRHTILRFANSAWYIQDLGSSSGTYVNGKRIEGLKLNPGDKIAIGNNTFTFLSD